MYNLNPDSYTSTRHAEWEREVRAMRMSRAAGQQTSAAEGVGRVQWSARLADLVRQTRHALRPYRHVM